MSQVNSTSSRTAEALAFLGMGIMGAAMASHLAAAGHTLRVWNRTAGKTGALEALGALTASSLSEAVSASSLIFTCLGDEKDVESVLLGEDGVLEHLPAGSVVVDFSTIGPETARRLSERFQAAGSCFLDAPVTGGDVGARNGTLTIMVGGEATAFERVRPFLDLMGKTLVHCGASGSGQALKLCNQVLCSVNLVALLEAMTLARRLGLSESLVVESLGNGAGGSWALSNLGPRILKRDFAPGFSIRHMLKDLRLVGESLNEEGLALLGGTQWSVQRFNQVVNERGGEALDLGTQAMYLAYEDS